MKKIILFFMLLLSVHLHADAKPLRVAVIGGITMSGLWEEISAAFEKKYGIPTELVVTGPKGVLNAYAQKHPVDFITMHSSDTISNLASSGMIEGLTPWIHNAQMLISERSNPAKISDSDTIEAALKKIEETNSTFMIHLSGGTFEVFHEISSRYAFYPNVVLTQKKHGFLKDVVSRKAYTLFGVIPFLMQKHSDPDIRGYLIDAEALHRPYLAATGTIERIGEERYRNARLLVEFLTSPEVQQLIRDFRLKAFPQVPVFFPARAR
ncbi:MAG: substrate-binding domain-containing protein [Sulfurovum sp.]|nr:substrate-binding domain-containing protein [Sulfurovum sp.]